MTFKYRTRKLIKPEDLNCRGALFGGRLLSWIDEECGIYSACQMQHTNIITKYMSEMNFISAAGNGEVLEIGVETSEVGRSFISVRCHVREMHDKRDIIKIDKITFVALNAKGRPTRHALYKRIQHAKAARVEPITQTDKIGITGLGTSAPVISERLMAMAD